ncbi:hypothetical protein N7463_003877 [Penicillium fimorum]|uniref:Uncharacterized protein n=1 Tax=Penicillium fimorum TaxID=1882269 RepID=A0A9X0CAC6_9EURO|nr:hypothetical protein N7463_003877 [Penicillium fimorum]
MSEVDYNRNSHSDRIKEFNSALSSLSSNALAVRENPPAAADARKWATLAAESSRYLRLHVAEESALCPFLDLVEETEAGQSLGQFLVYSSWQPGKT